jgi:predicted MPP superfamily phosphohydrolase
MMQRSLSRRQFIRKSFSLSVGAALLAAGGVDYARKVEPNWLDIERVRLTLPRLSPAFDGYRIAQISDIHMGGWMTRERFADVAAAINGLDLDLVAITGDFVTSRADLWTKELSSVLSTVKAHDGTVAVLGNHDQFGNRPILQSVLRDSGIVELNNSVWTLRRGGERFHIAGVDDVWHKQDRLGDVMRKLPNDGAALLLAHEPDFADTSAATRRFDLQISGHSHGGQVVVPMLGPQRLPPYGRKYPLGLYKVSDMLQYTNRGVGMVRPYVRFNCRPEVTVFTLEAA